MKLNLINTEITKVENELLCIPIYEEGDNVEMEKINTELDGIITELNDNGQISSKLNSFTNSDYIMKYGLLIGCHQGLTMKDILHIQNVIINFINKKAK